MRKLKIPKTVTTRSAKGRMDSLLSVSMLTLVEKVSIVKRGSASKNASSKHRNEILVDVGREFNPAKGLFDHHQDKDMDSSFILITDYYDIPLHGDLVSYFNIKDTKGPKVAQMETGFSDLEADGIQYLEHLILDLVDEVFPDGEWLFKMFGKSPYHIVGKVLKEAKFELSYRTLIDIWEELSSTYTEDSGLMMKDRAKYKRKLIDAIRKVHYITLPVGKVAVPPMGTGVEIPLHFLDSDIMLSSNKVTNTPRIIINTDALSMNEVLEVLGNPPTEFIHPGGFMVSLDIPWEELMDTLESKAI